MHVTLYWYTNIMQEITNKIKTLQRAIERSILTVSFRDHIRCNKIRRNTKVTDIMEKFLRQKW